MSQTSLRIRREMVRPPAAIVQAFAGAATGHVCDAQGRRGALHGGIRAMTTATAFTGTALTVWAGPRDNLGPWAALEVARPGDVLMVATGDYDGAAVMGDVLVGMARNAGIVAVVTDGVVRDREGLDALGLPVFARGLSPNSPFKHGPAVVGEPIALGGCPVAPGDIVVGDGDGVVVVAAERAEAVAGELAVVRTKEAEMERAVADGVVVPDWLDATLARLGTDRR